MYTKKTTTKKTVAAADWKRTALRTTRAFTMAEKHYKGKAQFFRAPAYQPTRRYATTTTTTNITSSSRSSARSEVVNAAVAARTAPITLTATTKSAAVEDAFYNPSEYFMGVRLTKPEARHVPVGAAAGGKRKREEEEKKKKKKEEADGGLDSLFVEETEEKGGKRAKRE